LTTLTKHEKDLLIENNVILTKELFKNSHLLDKIGISALRKEKVLNEIKKLCDL
jgi:hypothetical protein